MIIGKVLKLIKTGKFRTMMDIQKELRLTTDELKGILDILVVTGKLKKTDSNSIPKKNYPSCSMCKQNSACLSYSECKVISVSQSGNVSNGATFYQPIGKPV
jgi:hypothetical protein